MTTAAVADVDEVFLGALAADAGAPAPDAAPAPPRVDVDPEAPHGRAADGTPLAPHGFKADGTPRRNSPGPGRGRKGPEAARVAVSGAPTAPGGSPAAADYTDDLMTLGTTLWVGASSLKGGRLLGFPLPDCRPYAALWHAQLPQQAAAWNVAAQQNPTVRGYVKKFTGEGAMTWVIAVAVAGAGFAAGCAEIARGDAATRDRLAAVNDMKMQAFIAEQTAALEAAEMAAAA